MNDLALHVPASGWVFYDAECPFCVRRVGRWGGVFGRRGFWCLPLQTPGTEQRLGVSADALRAELKLLLPDGRVLGGSRAVARLCRAVWWLWPFGALLEVPGLRGLGQWAYRALAQRRHRLGAAPPFPAPAAPGCARPPTPWGPRRRRVFFEFP